MAATGKLTSGIGQAKQYRYQARIDQQNAALSNEQAQDSIATTNLEAQRRYRELAQTKGGQQAAMAANGVDLNFGSAVDVQRDTAMIGAEDATQIYKSGNERTRGFETNAWNYRSNAAANRAKAKGAITGAVFGALSTALGGASQAAQMNKPLSGGKTGAVE